MSLQPAGKAVERLDKFVWQILEKKTEAVNAYNQYNKGEETRPPPSPCKKKRKKRKKKGGGGGGRSASTAKDWSRLLQ